MSHARGHFAGDGWVAFAHRYITRPFDAGGENHVELSEAEFDARLGMSLFAMQWASHGHRYGIGCEINHWLAKGITVVMNGSREYLPEARKRYPELRAVLVTVQPEILAQRLRGRGREDEATIARRVARAAAFSASPDIHYRLANDGRLEEAGASLVKVILACREETRACA